jgi:hypothetical protein
MKKTTFTPPYTSVAEFVKFIALLRSRRPDTLSQKSLEEIGIGKSNSYTLLGSLKAMGLYDEDGTLLQRDDLSGLGSRDEQIRQASFKNILERAYANLIEAIAVQDATIEKVRHYFVVNGVAPSIAIKAARLFIWLAGQAGFETAEEFSPYNLEQEKPKRQKEAKKKPATNGSTKGVPSEPAATYIAGPIDYEERLLNILLEKISSTNELPSAEILQQVRELIELHKEKSNSKQAKQATLPLMGDENQNA